MQPFDKSSKRRGPMRLLMLSAVLPSALLLQACATVPSAPRIHIPQSLRKACDKPTSPMRTQADDDTFKVQQEAALKACDARGTALVEIIDGVNEAVKEKKRFGVF